MRHLFLRSLLITPVLVLIAFAQGAVSPAWGMCGVPDPLRTCGGYEKCHCGDTVVVSRTLDGSDPVVQPPGCLSNGLYVASGVTLQIRNTITHQDPEDNNCSGIVVLPGATKVVVEIGTIVGFDVGVEAGTSGGKVTWIQLSRLRIENRDTGIDLTGDDNVIDQNIITGATSGGIAGIVIRDGSSRNLVSRNQIKNVSVDGIILEKGSSNNTVSKNVAEGSNEGTSGFIIDGDHAIVKNNQSTDHDISGFQIKGTNHQVTNNVALRNGADGFEVDCIGCTVSQNTSNFNGSALPTPEGAGFNNTGPPNTYTLNRCKGNVISSGGLCTPDTRP